MLMITISFLLTYTVEGFTFWQYCSRMLTRKYALVWTVTAFLIRYTGLVSVALLSPQHLHIPAVIFTASLLNLILIPIFFQCRFTEILHHILRLGFIMLCSIMVSSVLCIPLYNENDSYFVLPILRDGGSQFVYLALTDAACHIFTQRDYGNLKHILLFYPVPLVSAIIMLGIHFTMFNFHLSRIHHFVILMLALLGFDVILYALYGYLQRIYSEYYTLQLTIQQEHADNTYYKALQRHIDDQNVLIHDIKNHLQVIYGLAESEKTKEITDYITQLNLQITSFSSYRMCNDSNLNLILSNYKQQCLKKGVDFECDVRKDSTAFIDESSTTALFGNLLSNALEAAQLSKEKWIKLSARCNKEQNYIVIMAENSCDAPPVPAQSGFFQSTKKKSWIHGTGIKSIEQVITRYDGVSTRKYDVSSKKFTYIIKFPQK